MDTSHRLVSTSNHNDAGPRKEETTMCKTYIFIAQEANRQCAANKTITGQDLILILTANTMIAPPTGKPYTHGYRGIYSALDAAYDYAQVNLSQQDADAIAYAFVDLTGEPAWRNK
jgi:hypothetical protein